MNYSELALNVILKVLNEKGITEYVLTKECGLSSGFMSDWKAGRRKSPSFDKVLLLLRYLGISVDSLNAETGMFSYIDQAKAADVEDELNDQERRIVAKYRSLDLDGKDSVRGFIIQEERRCLEADRRAGENNIPVQKII